MIATVCGRAAAQGIHCRNDGQDQPISTDRPTVTNSSSVVPCHSLQVESGLLISSKQDRRGYDLPESLLRVGLTKSTEFRFGAPDYFQNFFSGGSFVTGIGDLALGMKKSLLATKSGFDFGVIGTLTFPTGANAVSSHGYDPLFQLLPSQKLPANLNISSMLSIGWPTQGNGRNLTGQSSMELDRGIGKRTDIFGEYSGSFPGKGRPQHTLDFGALYLLGKRQQVDVDGGFGLSSAATDHFVGIGYSVRFDL